MLPLATPVRDIVGLGNGPKGLIGIEIEVESKNQLPHPPQYWQVTMDGSLRGAYNAEYVLQEPLSVKAAGSAIDHLKELMELVGAKAKDSVRAGVHIHMNMLGASLGQLWTLATCYYVLEEALTTRFCGDGRAGNHFCLRAIDADVLTFEVTEAIRKGRMDRLAGDHIRYSALNYNSLFRHGSLEFRALRTPIDFDRIKTWIDLLVALKENSKLFRNPQEVIAQFSMGGEINFLRQMLGPLAEELRPFDLDLERMLQRGVRVAQEIGYAVKEWK